MKPLLILTLITIITGCAGTNQIHEDNLYVTKKYVGDFVQQIPEKRRTNLITTTESFYVVGHPELKIPGGARCYVKYSAESRAGSVRKFWVLYFTWDGSDDLYMIAQNPYTGEVY